MKEAFRRFACKTSEVAGSPIAFLLALSLILVWAITGPLFGWSDSHSLFINTVTTCITFLMVFLVQSTQNRDAKAMQLKLDEIIRSIDKARNEMIDIEHASDENIQKAQEEFFVGKQL